MPKPADCAALKAAPGLRKNDLVAEIFHAGITGVDDIWGDYPAIVPLTPSGLDATAAHLTWNGDPMREGEATFFELSGCYRRYHAPLCRTVYLGTPPQDMREAEKAQIEGIEAGLDTASIRAEDETILQPGMTFHFMPALWMENWGLETTETILITDNGPAEALCDMPRKLFVKD